MANSGLNLFGFMCCVVCQFYFCWSLGSLSRGGSLSLSLSVSLPLLLLCLSLSLSLCSLCLWGSLSGGISETHTPPSPLPLAEHPARERERENHPQRELWVGGGGPAIVCPCVGFVVGCGALFWLGVLFVFAPFIVYGLCRLVFVF